METSKKPTKEKNLRVTRSSTLTRILNYKKKEQLLSYEILKEMAQGFELIFEDLVEMNEDKKNKIRNLFLYKDLLLITKKDTKKNKYAICEYINLLSSKFSFSSEEKTFTLIEEKAIDTYPFQSTSKFTFCICNQSTVPFQKWITTLEKLEAEITSSTSQTEQLNSLTERDWAILSSTAKQEVYGKDQVIIEEGKDFTALYRIIKGNVRVQTEEAEQPIAILHQNQFFGEMSFLDRKTNASIITNEEEVIVLSMPEEKINPILETNSELSERFFQTLCNTLAFRLHNLPLRGALSKLNDDTNEDCSENALSLSGAIQAVRTHKDEGLRALFKISTTEIVIKEFQCKYKKSRTLSIHGSLIIFQQTIGFYSKIFGYETKFSESLPKIIAIEYCGDHKLLLQTSKDRHVFSFSSNMICDDAFRALTALWKPERKEGIRESVGNSSEMYRSAPSVTEKSRPEKFLSLSAPSVNSSFSNSQSTTQNKLSSLYESWQILFNGAKCNRYAKDAIILRAGEVSRKVYQIGSGLCRVEVWNGDKKQLLGRMKTGEIFGEITYLFGGRVCVNIIADEEDVEIYSLEKEQLQKLFDIQPDLAAKFYKFLAVQISNRLRKGERLVAKSQSQREITRELSAAHFALDYLGMKKTKLTQWWLDLIKSKTNEFLTALEYDFTAVPDNYIDQAPESLSKVEKNSLILRQLMDRSSDKYETNKKLIIPLKTQIYIKIDLFIEQAKEILKEEDITVEKCNWDELIQLVKATYSQPFEEAICEKIISLIKDLQYLENMKKYEFEYYTTEKSQQEKGELSDIVPITGLIIGRIHRLENETRTCLEVWSKKCLSC